MKDDKFIISYQDSNDIVISRQMAIDELIAMREHIDARMSIIGSTAYDMAIEALREPERKTGVWIQGYKEESVYKCSECNSKFTTPWDFCPHCGAAMLRG